VQAWLRRSSRTKLATHVLVPEYTYMSITYTKANSAHSHHGQDIQPSNLEPLSKGRARVHRVCLMTVTMAATTKSESSTLRRRRRPVGGLLRRPGSASKERHDRLAEDKLYKGFGQRMTWKSTAQVLPKCNSETDAEQKLADRSFAPLQSSTPGSTTHNILKFSNTKSPTIPGSSPNLTSAMSPTNSKSFRHRHNPLQHKGGPQTSNTAF
jgi:hypothetical protein